MASAPEIVAAGAAGAVIGSFLNVVAHRVPRGESLVSPGSRCPGCGTPIKPYDNVPVLSWLLLRGRCRACGVRISPRYPLVEAINGLPGAAGAGDQGAVSDAWLGLAFVLVLVPIVLINLDVRLIPNKLTLIGSV